MTVPQQSWSLLDAAEKRRRLLDAAERVFARDGIDAPIPDIAAAAGTGIGTVYRQFTCKDDLIAALVLDRLAWGTSLLHDALEASPDGGVFARTLAQLVERQGIDDVLAEALERTSEREEVVAVHAGLMAALRELLDRARAGGEVREDATLEDLMLLFTATRAAERRLPGGGRRMLALLLDALRAGPPG